MAPTSRTRPSRKLLFSKVSLHRVIWRLVTRLLGLPPLPQGTFGWAYAGFLFRSAAQALPCVFAPLDLSPQNDGQAR